MLTKKELDSRKPLEYSCLEQLVPKNHLLRKISKLQYQIELVLNYDLKTNYYNEHILSKCISNNSSGVL